MSPQVRPWVEGVDLHPDVLSEDFSEDVFALDLGPLAEGGKHVPAVYRDPEHFFRASFLTTGLRALLKDVLERLSGGQGAKVLKLVTPFGGGKSHTLASLLHAARSPKALDALPEARDLPRPKGVRTAVFDGQFFDATEGKTPAGSKTRVRTMWGWLAWQLAGEKGYGLLRAQDEARIAPGGDVLIDLLGDQPNLILLDEVLHYLISAGGLKVEQTTLRDETLTFLQRLTSTIGNTKQTALVFTLQSSKRESLEYTSLLQTVEHLAARKDQRREPVEGNETLSVIQRRLLAKTPSTDDSTTVAAGFQETVTQMRRAAADSAAERQQADDEGIALRDRIRAAYPFHPALVDIMRERWAAIPDFQRTRGALRFLAACLRACHREGKSRALLGAGDVPIHDPEVRLAFFKEVGQQADFQAVLEHDFVGANARARRIDERRAKENHQDALRRPASRLATAILMFSFGGLRRDGGGKDGDALPPGVSEPELLAACVGPDLDRTTAEACLKELREQCLYLHFDGVRYCFKKDPNVTLLLEQEADAVARDERRVRAKVKELLEQRLAGHRAAVVWPETPMDVADREPLFLFAYLPLEFATKPRATQEEEARAYLEKYGDKPRQFRNGLALVVPAAEQVEVLRRAVRYLLAAEQIKSKAKQLGLTDDQKSQLRERESTEAAAAESAFLKLYAEAWFPRAEGGGVGIEKVAAGGRPLQTTLADRRALVHQRVLELVVDVQPRVFNSVTPTKLIELFRLGDGSPPALGIRSQEVLDGFYSFLGFTRLMNAAALKKAVSKGVADGLFAYTSGATPALNPERRYDVAPSKVRFHSSLPEDEVDLESGFLMMSAALPAQASAPEPGAPPATSPPPGGGPTHPPPSTPTSAPPAAAARTSVELAFSADRNQLFKAWNALANLADQAGEVSVSVRAERPEGFDKAKLENGVLEPLREADLIE